MKEKIRKLKPFKELSIKGQKKRIVQDALLQIDLGKIIPSYGKYFYLRDKFYEDNLPKSLKIALSKKEIHCECCAKGALFASCVMNVNRVNSDFYYDIGFNNIEIFEKRKLSKWFSAGELDTIEAAFEGCIIKDSENILRTIKVLDNHNAQHIKTDLAKRAIAFGRRYKNPTNRLKAILNNILVNGSFKP